jgi:hypothetical protein
MHILNNNKMYHKKDYEIIKQAYKQKRLTVTQYSSVNGTKKLMMFTNTNKIIYAAAMACYSAAKICY